jgi:hypothetical protein
MAEVAIEGIPIFVFRNITTTDLYVENNIPPQSPIKISTKANAIINVHTNTMSEEESIPFTYIGGGILVDLNGNGYVNKSIIIEFNNQNYIAHTDNQGNYNFKFENNVMHEGNHQVLVTPFPNQYSDFNVTQNLVVNRHTLSSQELFQQLTTAIGTGIAIIGIILIVPNSLVKRKQIKYLSAHLLRINTKFDEFNKIKPSNKKEYVEFFMNSKNEIIYLLKNKKINEDQYKILDDKINHYLEKIDINK